MPPSQQKLYGALTPVGNADGSIRWQEYDYGSLLAALRQDLQLDASTDLAPGSLATALAGTQSSMPGLFKGYRVAGFTTLISGWAFIPLDGVVNDPSSCLNLGTGKYVVPATGWYLASANINMAGSTGNTYAAAIYKNGVEVAQEAIINAGTGGINLNVVDVVKCVKGDTLELWTFAPASQGLNVNNTNFSYLSVTPLAVPVTVTTVPAAGASSLFARKYMAGTMSPASATWTQLALDTVPAGGDPLGLFSGNQYVVPVAGVYHVDLTVAFGNGTTNSPWCSGYIAANADNPGSGATSKQAQGSSGAYVTTNAGAAVSVLSGNMIFAAGDKITPWVYAQVSGTNMLAAGGGALQSMSVYRVA